MKTLLKAIDWFLVDRRIAAILTLMTTFGIVAPEKATALRDILIGLFAG